MTTTDPAGAAGDPGASDGPPVPADGPARRISRKRPAKPQFAQTILILEALVVVFATLVGYGLRVAPTGAVWTAGGVLVVTLVLLSGLVSRPGGYVAGSVAQGAVLACGTVVPMMYVVGGVFAVMWVVAIRLGERIDRERAEWDAAHPGEVSG